MRGDVLYSMWGNSVGCRSVCQSLRGKPYHPTKFLPKPRTTHVRTHTGSSEPHYSRYMEEKKKTLAKKKKKGTPRSTWCSPEGRVSRVICGGELSRVGSRGFLGLSVECRCANGPSVDVCKSVHKPAHAGTHPRPRAPSPGCSVAAARIWRHVFEHCMWKRYPREGSLVTKIGLSWPLPCIVTRQWNSWRGCYSSGGLARTPPMESLQPLNQKEQYQTLTGGEMIPGGVNYSVYFFLWADMGSRVRDCKGKGFPLDCNSHRKTICVLMTRLSLAGFTPIGSWCSKQQDLLSLVGLSIEGETRKFRLLLRWGKELNTWV